MTGRPIEAVRGGWGAALLVAPRWSLRRLGIADRDGRAVVVTRILGGRHLVQAASSGIGPSPEVLAAGVWVDTVHAAVALGLAAADRRRWHGGLLDAAIAAGWAGFGWRDLHRADPRRVSRPDRRDQLARALLPLVPGGPKVLAAADRARRNPGAPHSSAQPADPSSTSQESK